MINVKKIQLNGLDLEINVDHSLPVYHQQFCMYDRLVPYLARFCNKFFKDGGTIIDIGANVGDTLASMITNTNAKFLCIEPNDEFFTLLKRNVANMPINLADRVKLKKCFIAKNPEENYSMAQNQGTAHKVIVSEKAATESKTLRQCIEAMQVDYNDISLIKVDTDGFDWECLISMGNALQNISPILYWENQFETEEQFNGYLQLNEYLKQYAYDYFFVFDNYGNYISEGNHDFYVDMNKYMRRVMKYKTGRSFVYMDVIGCKLEYVYEIRKMIQAYLNNYK